jgi:NHLM bacteriocin system ABC transporter ATP-binding protein
MTDELARHFVVQYPELRIGSHEPLDLSRGGNVWWLEEGLLDVFAVPAREGEQPGAREHLYRINAGEFFFGLDDDALPPGWMVIGVATVGTRLRELAWQDLASLADQAAMKAPLATLVDAWVSATTRGARKGIQPKQYIPLRPGEEAALSAGDVFFPVDRLVFVRLLEGSATFLSGSRTALDAASPLTPARNDAWFTAADACRGTVCSPEDALAQPDIWSGLRDYHRLIVCHSLGAFESDAVRESERMRIKAEHAASHLEAGMRSLTSLLQKDEKSHFAELGDDPLLAACRLIGRRIGVEFEPPPRGSLARADPVEEIANAARIRFRQVALRGEWWLSDSGHLLARIQESRQPVALIRVGSHYELHDPVAHTVTRVDETVAGSLVSFATSFFRALPARPLKLPDLWDFAMQGIGADLGRLVTLALLIGTIGMLMPIITGYVFDTVIPASDRSDAWQIIGVLIAVALASGMFSVARGIAMLRIESRVDSALQAALWDRALNLPIPFFRDYTTGDLAQRLNAVNAIRQALSGNTLIASFFSLINMALLYYYSAKLALVATALVLGAALLTLTLGLFKLRYERHMSEAAGTLSGLVLEYLRGVTKLRVTGSESRAFANWAREFSRLKQLSFSAGNVQNINDVFFTLYQVLVEIAIFATVALVLLKEAAIPLMPGMPPVEPMSTGQFIAFYGAFGQVMGAIVGLSTTMLSIIGLVPVYERAKPILQAVPEAASGGIHPGELQGQIDVVNATFHYHPDGPPILDNVSFTIRPGGFIAVVGPSGSGKSTLLRCLLGFERLSSGGIFFDNQNLADLDVRAVRRQMGVVLQHSQVMTGDLFGNIVGTNLLNIDDAWEAARHCGLEDDIKAMPMGMHTIISEGGNTLSGGQRQRILIARAIVQRPRILFFDEATSALDNRTQEIVTKSLDQLRATRVVIAHRLTTVMNADRIFVMDRGHIIQAGNYHQLMAEEGMFRELARRQLL